MNRRGLIELVATVLVAAVFALALMRGDSPSAGFPAAAADSAAETVRPDPVKQAQDAFAGDGLPAGAPIMVHMGDSYAAGAGVTPLVEDSPFTCQRSQRNFGELLARQQRWHLTDVSCSGARTADLERAQYEGVPPQLDALNSQVKYVTMTLGGNDSNVFSTVVGDCPDLGRTNRTGSPCRTALRTKLTKALQKRTLPDLTNALREVRKRAPNATVFVVGYPWIMPGSGGCYAATSIASDDVPFVHDLQRRLNAVVEEAAGAAGAEFVDMSDRSEGHDACTSTKKRWVEPLTDGPGSMHPNAAGQQAMAAAVAAELK
ncbi:MAG: SGNH/GDSL hydrolase family protein [Gordonia sp. (in: high G+C Gram-positive bacteria)]